MNDQMHSKMSVQQSASDDPRGGATDASAILSEWIEKYANAIYALAYSRMGDYHYAQDIAQETFLKAYLNRHYLKDPSKAGSWLYTIAVRTILDWARTSRIRSIPLSETGELDAGPSTEDIVISREKKSTVWHALGALDEASRTVLVLFHMNDWSLQEIGEFLNIGIKTVDSRLRRAREKLRDQWIRTVEHDLRAHKPAASFHQKLLGILSEGSCDRLIVKEGLQLTGNTDGVFAFTAKRYGVPFLLDVTAKTDSTNIRLKFAKGGIILNWEHDPDEMIYNDPADGTSERVSTERIETNKWVHIQWYMDEKLSAVVVDGKLIHASRGDYGGLSGQIGIGPAWSSVVTVKSFRIHEHPRVDNNKELCDLIKMNSGARINIRMLASEVVSRSFQHDTYIV